MNEIPNNKIREYLAHANGVNWLRTTISMDNTKKVLDAQITNKNYLNDIENVFIKYKKIEKGEIAPNFELKDTNEELVSLKKDLLSKLVY